MIHENPYEPPTNSEDLANHQASIVEKRVRMDIRSVLVAFLSIVLGSMAWKVQSYICGTPFFEPSIFGMFGYFVFAGFATGSIDPRNPFINCAMMYLGAYVFALRFPFVPPIGYIPGAVIAGWFFNGLGSLCGALIPLYIASIAGFRINIIRRWAGYSTRRT